MAVAVLGDKDAVDFVPLSGQQRIPALQTGEIGLLPRTLIRTLPQTLQRDANGTNFTSPNGYEITGFMVPKSLGVTKVEVMAGAAVCVQTGSTTDVVVADVSGKLGLGLEPVVFDNTSASQQTFYGAL